MKQTQPGIREMECINWIEFGEWVPAVSFSSARTMKCFPSPRCACAIQIVRPRESMADTQPQLQPALLRLSAMISQDFTTAALTIVKGPFALRQCQGPPYAVILVICG